MTETEHLPGPPPDPERLRRNAALYRFDPVLEKACALFDTDVAAWLALPPVVQDASGMYLDSRAAYRRAVAAGAIQQEDQ